MCASNHYCLPATWKCDGERDCLDDSDEADCTNNSCEPWQFQCANKRCILRSWVCDRDNDCHDGSDELNCTITTPNPSSSRPFVPIFPKGNCSTAMFECANTHCVPLWWKCDGQDDCGDGSDELACPHQHNSNTSMSTTTVAPDSHTCGENHFQCNNGDCIWESWVCDQEADCADAEDEENCHGRETGGAGNDCTEFRCHHSGGCIPHSAVCNGRQDCADNTDEIGCGLILPGSNLTLECPRGSFRCDGSMCLPLRLYCNNATDCYDGTDESNCSADKRVYQVSRIIIDDKYPDSKSLFVEWEIPPPPAGVQLQYLPSYSMIGRNTSANEWINTTWTNATEMRITNLTAYTQYNVTVYVKAVVVQNKSIGVVHPPSLFVSAQTAMGAPSSPWNVTLHQTSHSEVQVRWNPPAKPNGLIITYRVFVEPTVPPLVVSVQGSKTEALVGFKFVAGTNYSFQVVAENLHSAGEKSTPKYLTFDGSAIIPSVENLRISSVDNTSVLLAWSAPGGSNTNVTGYQVVIRTSQSYYAQHPTVNTTSTTLNVTGLSPGTRYNFEVSARRLRFVGPPTLVTATTSGDELSGVTNLMASLVKGDMTAVKLEWHPPKDKRKLKWEYGIYYGVNLKEMYQNGVRYRTTDTTFTVKELAACESFTFDVALVGPIGYGPGSDGMVSLTTDFDHRSPPKNVAVRPPLTGSGDMAIISWSPPCVVLGSDSTGLGYRVNFRDVTLDKVGHVTVQPSRNASVQLPFEVHHGAVYEITVQTDAADSRPSPVVTLAGPAIPPPHQLSIGKPVGGNMTLYWRDQDIPQEIVSHNFTYVVWMSKDSSFRDLNKTLRYETKEAEFQFPVDHRGEMYYVSVSIEDSHGYSSVRSDPLDMLYVFSSEEIKPSNSVDAQTGSSSHVYVAVSIGVIIALALGASLVLLLIRHRRLQRSFVSFATTHFNTRSEAAVFSDQGLEDDDSPVIRGFSDDEPLVIA